MFLRIPAWVDKKAVQCRHNDNPIEPVWVGNYLMTTGLSAKDTIAAEFPMEERIEKYHGYTINFKGNTVVDINPREHKDEVNKDQGQYQIYLRDHYKGNNAPMKKVTRYVNPTVLRW